MSTVTVLCGTPTTPPVPLESNSFCVLASTMVAGWNSAANAAHASSAVAIQAKAINGRRGTGTEFTSGGLEKNNNPQAMNGVCTLVVDSPRHSAHLRLGNNSTEHGITLYFSDSGRSDFPGC